MIEEGHNFNQRHGPHSPGADYRQWLRPALAVFIVALVYFYRLDQPPLWGDEADTGIEARNILRCGYPTAWDGRNVSFFKDGSQLDKNLACNKIPWIQYYFGALSLLIFGNNTLGLRVLFAFCGVLSFFPIYAILKSRLRYPAGLTVLTLLSPQVVLLQRNARYYPLLILIYAVLVWHVLANFKSARNHFMSAALIFVLFFHIHSFAALCSALSLIVFCLLFRREALASYFFAGGIGFASWLAWHQLLGPPLAEIPLAISLITTSFGLWGKGFCAGLLITIIAMDVAGCLPILLWTALLAFLLTRGRGALRNLFRERLYAFVFLNILIQAAVDVALFGSDPDGYSHLRYLPHLLVFGLIGLFMILNAVIASKSLYLFISLFVVAFNFLTLSFWAKPFSSHAAVSWLFPAGFWSHSPRNNSGRVPVSWLFPVYAEILRPRENAWDQVISRLESEAKDTPGHNSVLVSFPAWTQQVAIFYLGDYFLIQPILEKPTPECMQALRKIMGEPAWQNLSAPPEWVLDVRDVAPPVPPGFGLAAVFPSYQTKRPDDGSRPELNCHDFTQAFAVSNVTLFHLQKK
jgi:hypothetical protein